MGLMDVTVDEVFSWRERTGFMGREHFGRRGAHANSKTYEELKRRCDAVEKPSWPGYSSLGVYLNSFNVHIDEEVPDGILKPCNCAEEMK